MSGSHQTDASRPGAGRPGTPAHDAARQQIYKTEQARLLEKSRWHPAEIALWLSALALLFLFPGRAMLFNHIAILTLFAISLDLILGYAGIISLGQGAFYGIGAYAAGLLAKAGGGDSVLSDPVLGLLFAGAVSGLTGFITSFLVLRGTDLTRLMVTLGVALIFQELANKLAWLTGGADGLQGVTPAKLLGLFEFDIYGRTACLYSMTVLFILFVIARKTVYSPFGLSLRAIKGNVLRAGAVGVPVHRRLVAIYTMGAVYAGIAGGLLAQTNAFVSLDVLDFRQSADTLLIVIFGGIGTLYGAIIGAIAFTGLYEVLSVATPKYWQFWLGLALVLLVLFARGGILGLASSWRLRLALFRGRTAP